MKLYIMGIHLCVLLFVAQIIYVIQLKAQSDFSLRQIVNARSYLISTFQHLFLSKQMRNAIKYFHILSISVRLHYVCFILPLQQWQGCGSRNRSQGSAQTKTIFKSGFDIFPKPIQHILPSDKLIQTTKEIQQEKQCLKDLLQLLSIAIRRPHCKC